MSNLFINRIVAEKEYKYEWESFFVSDERYETDFQKYALAGLPVKPNDSLWYLKNDLDKNTLSFGKWGTKQPFTNRIITTTQSEHLFSSSFWKKYSTNRCIIPVRSYFEWQTRRDGKKHKFKIEFTDKNAYFGGIWGKNSDEMTWITIITQPANEKTAAIHNSGDNKHRQPIVIRKENLIDWLDPKINSYTQLQGLITQFQSDEIICDDLDYEQTLFD